MPSVYLIDSNLLVYTVDRREPQKRSRVLEVLDALQRSEGGAVSTQTLGEFFAVSTRRIPDPIAYQTAREQVLAYIDSFAVYEVTVPIVVEATRAARDHQMSYWDAQIWATAKLNQIPYVLSEDLQGWDHLDGVRFVNPLVEGFDLPSLGISR